MSNTTSKKKAISQSLAIQDRRALVQVYLLQHYTPLQIAEKVDVKLQTVESDIKAIDKKLGQVYRTELGGKRERELADLDSMERDTIEQFQQAIEWGFDAKDAVLWISKRLDIKKLRGEWMGWKVKEPTVVDQTQDNRSITINITDPNGNKVPFDEWAIGQFRELPKELESGKEEDGSATART